jgi:hypothetical protein
MEENNRDNRGWPENHEGTTWAEIASNTTNSGKSPDAKNANWDLMVFLNREVNNREIVELIGSDEAISDCEQRFEVATSLIVRDLICGEAPITRSFLIRS